MLSVATALGGAAHAADESVAPPTQAELARDFLASIRHMADELTKTPGVVVAEIGDRSVTRGDVADAFRQLPATAGNRPFDAIYHDVVQRLLGEQALAIRAREQGMEKDPLVRRRMALTADRTLAEGFLQRAAAPAITEKLLQQTYDREVAGTPGPAEVRARVIVGYTETEANAALAALAGGADFADLARRVSRDASAAAGGDIGFVQPDSVSPEVAAVMFALAPGQTTAFPVRVGGVWFIIRVESRRQLATPPLDAVRDRLVQALQRMAVPTILQSAMTGLPVQDYGIAGKVSAPPSGRSPPVR